MQNEDDDIIIEQATVRCWTGYCRVCEEGAVIPFLRSRETPSPAMLLLSGEDLATYRAAEAAVRAWRDAHVHMVPVVALTAV